MGDGITYVGLDAHKEGIVVAVAEGGIRGEVREHGRIANTAAALDHLMRKLGHDGVKLPFCYAAGPCGYGTQRQLSTAGHECVVVAPSRIPIKAGDGVKTDRRDALMLAKLHRAGELTPIWIPDAAHEAMRDLVRARAAAGFAKARQLMPYVGLVPSEHSSGSSVRRGGITKAGNVLARRVLIEGAWTYRMAARVSRKLHDRNEGLSPAIRDIAWKGQLRVVAAIDAWPRPTSRRQS